MIQRPRVLRPDEVPDQELITNRGDALWDVREEFRQLRQGRAQPPFLIHGPPGSGKTMVVKHVLREHFDGVPTAYCDCWEWYGTQPLLAEVAKGLGVMAAKHNSTPTSDIVGALEEEAEQSRVVVLDELELVHETDPLETLAAAPDLAVVGIVNDPDEVSELLSAVWGGLDDSQKLRFREYSRRAIGEIVDVRADHALRDGSITSQRIRDIARRADGDARLAIATLRAAAQRCDWRGTIEDDDIEAGFEEAQRELFEAHVDRLSDHQHAVFEVVQEIEPAKPREIHRHYRRRVDSPRSRNTVNKYLSKMEWYGLVQGIGSTRSRKYRINDSGYVEPSPV